MQHYLTLDPGQGLGCAVWNPAYWGKELRMPVASMNLYPLSRYSNFVPRVGSLMHRLENEVLIPYEVAKIFLEFPEFFSGPHGRMAATRGSLVKLAAVTGAIMGVAQIKQIPLEYKTVTDWKGSTPKGAITRLVQELLPEFDGKSHAIDAVALGLEYQGYLTRNALPA